MMDHVVVRRFGGSIGRYIRLPANYTDATYGDSFLWIQKDGYVVLKPVTPELIEELTKEEEAVEAP